MSQYFDFAVELAKEAGETIMELLEKQRLERIFTSRIHFRTVVDEAVDKLLTERIRQRFPEHGIYSEEGGGSLFNRPLTWVNDSVDGTMNLWSGVTDNFSVCIALCENRNPIVGVINAPLRRELYCAEAQKGAFLNGAPIHVSKTLALNEVLMGNDYGNSNREASMPFIRKAMAEGGIYYSLCTACTSVSLALVAKGRLDAYLATTLGPEDMAAGVCVVREAGGKVTNIKGEEWHLGDASVFAANPQLHEKLSGFFGISE